VVTLLVQHAAGALSSLETFPIAVRIGNALRSFITYLTSMVFPADLICFYRYEPGTSLGPLTLLALLALVVMTVVAMRARRYPFLATGWLWYLVTLLPVIGLIQVGMQSHADRYTYVPLIGIFLVIAWGVPELAAALRLPQVIVPALAI